SQMVQFKGGGKAELHDVNIVVYGKNSNRFDQIYGAGFEYDEQQKIIRATGEVHIDLQADVEGVQHPDQAPPQELKNPVHMQTSGLVFDQNTGIAQTREQIQFRTPQASGTAMGALYNARENTLTLERDIRSEARGPLAAAKRPGRPARGAARLSARQSGAPAVITATHAVLHSNERLGILENVSATRGSETLRANAVTVRLRDDSSIETVVASGDVRASDRGASHSEFQSQRAEFFLNPRSMLERAVISGGAKYESAGARPMHGTASRVLVSFGPQSTIASVKAVENVDLVQEASSAAASRSGAANAAGRAAASPLAGSSQQRLELKAPEVDLVTRAGRSLERAFTTGASEIVITQIAT